MDPLHTGIILAGLGSISYGLRNAIIKQMSQEIDEYTTIWIRSTFAMPFMLLGLYFFIPEKIEPSFYQLFLFAGIFQMCGNISHAKAVKHSPISIIDPLLSLNVIIAAFVGYFVLNEAPSVYGIGGILLIAGGTYLLKYNHSQGSYLDPLRSLAKEKGARYAILTCFLYSFAVAFYKPAALASNTFLAICAINAFVVVLLFPYILINRKKVLPKVYTYKNQAAQLGLTAAISTIFLVLAMEQTLITYVTAMRQMSVFVSVALGSFMFSEKQISQRFTASIIMVLGVLLIAIK